MPLALPGTQVYSQSKIYKTEYGEIETNDDIGMARQRRIPALFTTFQLNMNDMHA